MLHLAQKLLGTPVVGHDGEIGTLDDFYFEPEPWAVRYLVVDTGKWFTGRRLLLPPTAVRDEWNIKGVPVELTREQAWESPDVDETAPVSRVQEASLLDYYGYPYYWSAPARTSNLWSVNRIVGCHIQATNGEIGHVDDVLVRQETFEIPFLLVDTSNWIGGRSVIVASDVLERVEPDGGRLYVGTTRDAIQHAPSLESIESAIHTLETGPPFTII